MTSSRRRASRREVVERADPLTGHELAAGRLELRHERRRHGVRPTADHRPADRVGVCREDEPERGTQRAIEAEHRVGGDPAEQRARRLVVEPGAGETLRPTGARAARTRMSASGWRGTWTTGRRISVAQLSRHRGQAARRAGATPAVRPPRPSAVATRPLEHRRGGRKRPCRLAIEACSGEPLRRAQGRQPEPEQRQGMAWHVDDRPENLRRELVGIADERPEGPSPGLPVRPAEADRGRRHRSLEDRRPAAVERMGDRRVRVDELDAVRGEVDRGEERRGDRQRQDRRAHVVAEAGERQLGGADPATGRVGGLVDPDRAAGAGEGDRRRQAVRAGPDDDRVEASVAATRGHQRRVLTPGR